MKPETRRSFLTHSAAALGLTALSGSTALGIAPIDRRGIPLLKPSCAAYSYRKYLTASSAPTMDLFDFLDECVLMGIGAAEPTSYYFPPDVDEEYLLRFRNRAFTLGLDISGTAIGNTFTFPAGAERDKNLALCNKWVDHAATMGAPVIRIFAGNKPDGLSQQQAIQNAIETTKIACEYAASKGVFLALENHGGIVARAEGLMEIVDGVNHEWFGVNLDTGNFHVEDPYAELAICAPYAINVQVKIDMRYGSETTPADFDRIATMLVDANYRGYVALEYEGSDEPMTAIPHYMEKLIRALDNAT